MDRCCDSESLSQGRSQMRGDAAHREHRSDEPWLKDTLSRRVAHCWRAAASLGT